MPAFSQTSRDRLGAADSRLQDLFNKVVQTYDCTVLVGFRDRAEQDAAVRDGRSKTSWPTSKHNRIPSGAVDVSPYPIAWGNPKRFYHFAGYVKAVADSMGIQIRWGGDWDGDNDLDDQTFYDLVHFELS